MPFLRRLRSVLALSVGAAIAIRVQEHGVRGIVGRRRRIHTHRRRPSPPPAPRPPRSRGKVRPPTLREDEATVPMPDGAEERRHEGKRVLSDYEGSSRVRIDTPSVRLCGIRGSRLGTVGHVTGVPRLRTPSSSITPGHRGVAILPGRTGRHALPIPIYYCVPRRG